MANITNYFGAGDARSGGKKNAPAKLKHHHLCTLIKPSSSDQVQNS